jgi:outer membrane lipoprotein-sorting protein
MKKTLLIIIGILLSINLSAQIAEEFFNNVIEKTKSYNDISIVFNYKIINKEAGIYETMSGYASMKGSSYKLNVDGQEMISDGKILWTHLIDDEEVMISEITEDDNNSPLAIIESFSNNVTVSFLENNAETKAIEIKENDGESFEKIILTTDKDFRIKKIHAYLGDGNELVYEITEFTTNQNLPDSMFTFDENLYPNVDVIDMR